MTTYIVKQHGDTFSVYENDKAILHNLAEWQAHAIAAILNG